MNFLQRAWKRLLDDQVTEYEQHLKPLTDAEFIAFHEKEYARLDPQVKEQGVRILKEYLNPQDVEFIRESIAKYGTSLWMTKIMGHFTWGMTIRNLLREEGLGDDLLPTKNWDSYYVLLIEEAVK